MEQQSMPGADPFREPTPPPRLPSQPSSYAEKLEDLKKDDSLPFDTVLSKDLPALQRGGYNNNRILNLQRAERDLQSARQAAAKAEAMTEQQLMSGAHPFREPTPSRLPSQPSWYADKQEGGSGSSTPSWLNVTPSIGAPPAVAGGPMRSESNETLSSLKSRLVIRSQPATGVTQITCDGEETSPQDIERNIRTAINACRSENSSVLRNRQQMTYVKKSLESGYCDVSARDGEFELIENVHGYTFYIASDIPNPQQVALGKQAVIGRFASEVVAPLQGVYKLPPSSLHIFYDTKGGLIAFNKRGGIFLNLRYYESWHDKDESSLSVVWMDANKEFVGPSGPVYRGAHIVVPLHRARNCGPSFIQREEERTDDNL
ncbi:hypothetical protein FRB99_000734 [Tulasnella sp. 403]|nr:hypothetical protein FRB99_000734 [Tulasnella sp. 403]